MNQLTYLIRFLMWLFYTGTYVGLAAWVGEGTWDDTQSRFVAVVCGMFWVWLGAIFIEGLELPQEMAKGLLEDQQS